MVDSTKQHHPGIYEAYLKRTMDVVLSLMAIICLSPALLIIAILVRIKLGAPIIFIQERTGINGKIFRLYKFRSMTDERGIDGELLPDEERLTSFGKKLRHTSLDELPELFNIIRGDMSIVGPRPLLPKYMGLYNEEQMQRFAVRPGLSSISAVSGRNLLSWEETFRMDVYYVQHLSFKLDMEIIIRTFGAVLSARGETDARGCTREAFKGNAEV